MATAAPHLQATEPRALVGTARHTIELREWESKEFRIAPAHLNDLLECASKVADVRVLAGGNVRLTAGPVVGRVSVGGVDLAIHPKCPIPALLGLLAEAYQLTDVLKQLAAYTASQDIVDLLVQMFLRQVDTLAQQGLKRTYVGKQEELVSVRGQLDLRRTIALHMRAKPRAWCTFEEFTLDGLENRALLVALHAVVANQSLLQIRRRLAHQLTTDFLGVSNIKVHATEIEKISYDRLTAHYEPALRMAQLILAAMGIAHESGGVRSNGFLLNMNSLFEKFIAHRLRRLLRHDGVLMQMQQQFDFDEQGQAKIQPDLVIQSPRGQCVVVDTKYKDRSNADASDLYQMLAYCRVLQVRRGVLITVGQAPRRCYRVRYIAHMK